jgi:hypothetical protein
MSKAFVVNIKQIAIVNQDKGKLNVAPSTVSVTDSSNAFLSIFIKKFSQV